MSEPNREQYEEMARIFVKKYNADFNENFVLRDIDEQNKEDYDLLFFNERSELKIQHTEATPCLDNEIGGVKKFEKQKMHELPAMNLQDDYWRVRKSVGHKSSKNYSTEKNMVLLLDFGLIPWDEANLDSMEKACSDEGNEFKNIYCVHIWKGWCEKLA